MLALNIVNRSFLELIKPLDYNQGAPIGFFAFREGSSWFVGQQRLRLGNYPACGRLDLNSVMYAASKRYIEKSCVLVSIGLLALSPRLIYYSSELRQYSLDVLATSTLLLIASRYYHEEVQLRKLIVFGVAVMPLSVMGETHAFPVYRKACVDSGEQMIFLNRSARLPCGG